MKKYILLLAIFIFSSFAAAQCVDLDDESTFGDKIHVWEEGKFEIVDDVTLCQKTYNMNKSILISDFDIILDCDGATLVGQGKIQGAEGAIYVGRIILPYVTYSPRATIRNCNIENWNVGIKVNQAQHNIIENNNIENVNYAISATGCSYSTFRNNILSADFDAFTLKQGLGTTRSNENEVLDNQIISAGANGIRLMYANNNTLSGNEIRNSQNRGMYISYSSDNLIYNNIFDNNDNVYSSNGVNEWNTALTAGTNILGDAYLGGNSWSDYTGEDTTGDGIGETPYAIGNEADQYPLVQAEVEEEIPEVARQVPQTKFDIELTNFLKENMGKIDLSEAPGIMRMFVGKPRVNLVILQGDVNSTYGFMIRDGKVVDFQEGGVERPHYVIEATKESLIKIGESKDPMATAAEMYKTGEIKVIPQKFFTKMKFGLATKLIKWFS